MRIVNAAPPFFEEGEITDFGTRAGMALLPFVGLDTASSGAMVKTETLPDADKVRRRRSDDFDGGSRER